MRMRPYQLLLLIFLISEKAAVADTADAIITERPSFVDSSETVGVGNLQIETGVQDSHDHSSINEWTIPTLLRLGVGENWELRFESDGYDRSDVDAAQYVDGWTNLTVGVKHHVTSDSTENVSNAWFAELELPTGATAFRGQGVRPSARWVTEWQLPAGYSFAVMPGLKYDSAENGHFLSGSFGATLGKNINDAAQVFVEMASPQIAQRSDGGMQVSFDTGAQYRIGKNFQIDAAVFLGLNHQTADATFTVGASAKW
jgi:hypothetical protein